MSYFDDCEDGFYARDLNGYYRRNAPSDNPRWVNPHDTRTKAEWPYSYSEFFLFGDRRAIKEKNVTGGYSDRLHGWEPEKYERLWKKHVNCSLQQVSPEQMSAFLTAYFDKPTVCVAMAEGCNPSNGYPYYVVWHKEAK